MTRFSLLLAALILPAGLALAEPPEGELPVDPYEMSNENAGADPVEGTALFEAFGGEDGIARVVDGMVDRSLEDQRIAGILAGPCDYTGRDMASSHKDHGITTREFNALVENLQAAMNTEGVPFRAQNKLLAKLAPMQRDVVTR